MGKNGNFKEIFGILKLEPKWCTGAKFQVKQPKDVARISGTNKQTNKQTNWHLNRENTLVHSGLDSKSKSVEWVIQLTWDFGFLFKSDM